MRLLCAKIILNYLINFDKTLMAFEVDCFDAEDISFTGTPTIVDDVDPPKN
jgi:hypothetical protein